MRSLLLCMTVIFMVSCQNPYGTVTTNDEKSEIIKTLFFVFSNVTFFRLAFRYGKH